jgi:predicted DNA-binding transcriptional regulator AlpA
MTNLGTPQYPLLEALLTDKGLQFQALYTNADVASLFGVSIRTIQNRIADGTLPSRKLIGRARFLPIDLEQFLAGSRENNPE